MNFAFNNSTEKKMTVLIKTFDKDFLSVSFPDFFNNELLNAVRSLPERKWNNEEKV